MRRLYASLLVMVAAVVVAVVVTVAPAGASLNNCNISQNHYKYAGGISSNAVAGGVLYNSSPANTYVRGRLTLNYVQFTAASEHSNAFISVDEFGPGTHYWAQVGFWFGYDQQGHPTINPATGSWAVEMYVEYNLPWGYYLIAPSMGNWPVDAPSGWIQVGHPYPLKISGDSIGVQTPQIGPADTFSPTYSFPANGLPMTGYTTINAYAIGEDAGADSWCDTFNFTFAPQSVATPKPFWNQYQGCSDYQFNGDVPTDPNCRGGAAAVTAPYDVFESCSIAGCPNTDSDSLGYLQGFLAEAPSGGGGLAPVNPSAPPDFAPALAPAYPRNSVTIDRAGVHVNGVIPGRPGGSSTGTSPLSQVAGG